MSTTSTRHLKDRGGGGSGKIMALVPTKTLTLISGKTYLGSARKSAGKENPNPKSISRVSGPAQKPAIRPIPRMSSVSTGDSDPRPRSRPRGRSPSPSDFTRILSDMRRTRVSSGDTSSTGEKGFRGLGQKFDEKCVNGSRVCTDRKGNANYGEKFRDICEKDKGSGLCRKENNLSVNSSKSSASGGNYALDGWLDHSHKDRNISGIDNVVACEGEDANQNLFLKADRDPSAEKNESESNFKGLGVKNVGNLKGSDVCKEKGVNKEGMDPTVGNKHTSKLHEKLAYLEGKVKRIASDIKKTKEMLDMDKTNASKMILLGIQEKISGIEKAMGSVKIDYCSDCCSFSGDAKCIQIDTIGRSMHESNENQQCDIFPQQELPQNWVSLKIVSKSNNASNLKNSSSPIDEDPIELEFLASLNKMQSEVIATDRGVASNADEVQETGDTETSEVGQNSGIFAGKHSTELDLQANERFDEFDDQENKPTMIVEEEIEDNSISQLIEIGQKTSTGGWFVSEGESVLLTHDDGSCSFYDIANQEEKAEYSPPAGISQNIWRDCWIIRAPGADGCSGKYVVAASAGNTMDSGFCSWDFYSKDVQAFHTEDNKTTSRVALSPLADRNAMYRRNALGASTSSENRQWWYRPCGPLIISTASCQRTVKVFDIRDGEQIMKWDVLQSPVLAMDYCSPLQWRNRGKVAVAETEAISVWDVSSLNPQPLSSVSTSGHRISALHVNNTDAELGGGVRQRVSSSEAEGNDGVFCTADSINVLDFRHPSGIGLKVPKIGVNVQTVSSRGDSVFLGCTSVTSAAKKQVCSQVLQFSLRRQRLVNAYSLPESNAHWHHKALTQVWGNSNLVMAVCGLGLFVFDASRGDVMPSFGMDYSSPQKVRQVIGPDDLYSPSFDYISSQILLISRDRPAMWRYLS